MKLLATNLVKISKILSDLNYHDGDSIGKKLGVTRSAVWKNIQKLEEYGIKISSIKGKGYQLEEQLLLLDAEEIIKEVANPKIKIEVFEEINSTNTYLKTIEDFELRHIAIAEIQNIGRGRMGRNWHSPFGQNLYLSYAYPFKKDVSELGGLSIIVGMAALAAIKEIGIEASIGLKWPNDGVFENHKLFGILVELQSEANSSSRAIIGIGINVNMLIDSPIITQKWTSLQKITDKYIDRNKLCIALIHNLNALLEIFAKHGLKDFLNQWHKIDALYGKEITINNAKNTGIAKGINEQGQLLLELKTGEVIACSSGETSI